MHQNLVVRDKILQLASKVQNIFQDVTSQQRALRVKLALKLEEIAAQQATLEQAATKEAHVQNEQYLREAGDKIAISLRTQSENILDDDEFSGSSDIEDILLAAEQFMASSERLPQ